MLKRKKIKIIISIVCFFMIGSASAFAASYSFSFSQPFVGAAKHSSPATADGAFTPYVNPGGTTNATTYVLTRKEPGSTATII